MQFNTLWRAPTGETGAAAASRAPRTRGARRRDAQRGASAVELALLFP